MVWRWDYSGYSLVCGGGVWCVHILHTCVWVCGWGVGMAVMCWGRWDDSVVGGWGRGWVWARVGLSLGVGVGVGVGVSVVVGVGVAVGVGVG